MTIVEAKTLKPGDLVYISHKQKNKYSDMVFAVDEIDNKGYEITLKQPGYDLGFRHKVLSSMISRYEGS